MRVAVIQGNYIPWIGYFALMSSVDKFLLYEDVQYTKNDWRNRNIIERNGRKMWLTIPVRHARLSQGYMETEVSDPLWAKKHFSTLQMNFGSLHSWHLLAPRFKKLYDDAAEFKFLHEINWSFLNFARDLLGINTPIERIQSKPKNMPPSASLLEVLKSQGASHYLSGPAAREYIDEKAFSEAGIYLQYADYHKLIKREFPWIAQVRAVTVLQEVLEGYDEFSGR